MAHASLVMADESSAFADDQHVQAIGPDGVVGIVGAFCEERDCHALHRFAVELLFEGSFAAVFGNLAGN